MKTIVTYKSKYGSTKAYAEWIAEELGCECVDVGKITAKDLSNYDTIIHGGGLYAEVIAGVTLITKNYDELKDKKLIVFTTGITPIDCREYYDEYVVKKNFKPHMTGNIKVFNFLGKMVIDELSIPHKLAIKSLKKLMAGKENPTKMEKMLIDLCDCDGDYSDRGEISGLVEFARAE